MPTLVLDEIDNGISGEVAIKLGNLMKSMSKNHQLICISRLPQIDGDRSEKKRFKSYPIGFFHIDLAEVRTEEGKLY